MKLRCLLLLIIVGFCFGEDKKTNTVTDIAKLMASPAQYLTQTTTLKGIVKSQISENSLFTLTPIGGCSNCSVTGCGPQSALPIRFTGDLPKVNELVVVTGMVKEKGKGYIYEAQSVRVLKDL